MRYGKGYRNAGVVSLMRGLMSINAIEVIRALIVLGLLQGALATLGAQAQKSRQKFEFIDVHVHLVGGRNLK